MMTRYRIVGLLAVLVLMTANVDGRENSTEIAEGSLRIRVLCYNIHHGEGIDRKLDLARIAGVIQSVRPDLVSLQEVDRGTQRTNQVDQPAELGRLTGMAMVFGGNLQFQGGDYGNAVLSRFPVQQHQNRLLPRFDEGEQRGVLEVEIELPDDFGTLLLLATHLDHRRADRERIASAQWINQHITDGDDRPAVLAGDLNATPDSPTLGEFEKIWTRANNEILPTFPVTQPTRQIDYILFQPADRWRVVQVYVLEEAVASDHRAIFAELELLRSTKSP
jgi:endonuclease/exonuclease/phosphatase family metal-dependent hydrolase